MIQISIIELPTISMEALKMYNFNIVLMPVFAMCLYEVMSFVSNIPKRNKHQVFIIFD